MAQRGQNCLAIWGKWTNITKMANIVQNGSKWPNMAKIAKN